MTPRPVPGSRSPVPAEHDRLRPGYRSLTTWTCLPTSTSRASGKLQRTLVTLQAAWDKGDITTLRSMMTDGMLAEIKHQLEEREAQSGGRALNQTDVVMIDAQLLGIEDLGDS